jgi:FkbM family methyltransferase
MAETLEEHLQSTKTEWENNDYFKKVIDFLKDEDIKTTLDVGGCTGEVSNILIKNIPSLDNVIVIEPVFDNYNFILNNVKSEKVNIEVINKALFYGQDSISLGLNQFNVGGYSAKWGNSFDNIPTITIETILEKYSIDFIKMDIEGSERNVIASSEKLRDIKYLEIEFHDEIFHPDAWKPFVERYLPNHQVQFDNTHLMDEGSCCSNAFFIKKK